MEIDEVERSWIRRVRGVRRIVKLNTREVVRSEGMWWEERRVVRREIVRRLPWRGCDE